MFQFGAGAEPLENFEAGELRHFEVEQEKAGKRMLGAIGVRRVAPKVSQDFGAIFDEDEFASESGFSRSHLQDGNFSFFVFRNKYGRVMIHL